MSTKQAQYTPAAPWQCLGTDGGVRVISFIDNYKRRTLAHVYGRTDAERDANACLIAAAPEMLASLEETIAVLRWYAAETSPNSDATGRLNRAEAAIAKARSQS